VRHHQRVPNRPVIQTCWTYNGVPLSWTGNSLCLGILAEKRMLVNLSDKEMVSWYSALWAIDPLAVEQHARGMLKAYLEQLAEVLGISLTEAFKFVTEL
jgi:hypothetical protein